MGQK
ncbi:unnamed protein product [Cuscuta epithymum]